MKNNMVQNPNYIYNEKKKKLFIILEYKISGGVVA